MSLTQTTFKQCSPVKGVDGKYYVAADFSDNFSPYHLEFERDRGNLLEVVKVREIHSEEEIRAGDLVSFGNTVNVWETITCL